METPLPDTDSSPVPGLQATATDSLHHLAYNGTSTALNGAPSHLNPTPFPDTDLTQEAPLPPPHEVFQESSLSPEPERRKVKRSSSASPPPTSPPYKSPPPATAAIDRVMLIVRDKENNEFTFKVKRTAPLRKVFEAFSNKMKEPASNFRFLYDGKRISPPDTVISLGMEDGDSIDAMVHAQGGQCRVYFRHSSSF